MPTGLDHPLAITMWDFSWLERRWTGGGFEDWDVALTELKDRGYDAVRIDAYPHLFAMGDDVSHRLLPVWNQQAWGSPMPLAVRVRPALIEFIRACDRHDVMVALSTWYRQDEQNSRTHILSPNDQAKQWLTVLDAIADAGLLESIAYVDLCNEWPQAEWAPFFPGGGEPFGEASLTWMREAIRQCRAVYPELDFTFSTTSLPSSKRADEIDLSFVDLLEPHIWMSIAAGGDYFRRLGYDYPKFDDRGFRLLADRAQTLYRVDENHWQRVLTDAIDAAAACSRQTGLPLVTTECWGIVDYKDGPGLDWDWVKDLCALGTRHAATTGRWTMIATSNFCAPQFVGMWRDIDWHRDLTDTIHAATLPGRVPVGL